MKNDEANKIWRAACPRKDIPSHRDTVICSMHWPENVENVLIHGKLRPRDDNPPSIFANFVKSIIPTPPPPPRCTKRTSAEIRSTQPDQMSQYLDMDKINNFEGMKNDIHSKTKDFNTPLLIYAHLENEIIIQSVDFVEGTGVPMFMFKIQKDLTFQAFHYGVRCSIPSLVRNHITRIKHWSEIEEMVRFLKLNNPTEKKNIISDQLKAMGVTVVGEKKYSIETTVRAFEYFALSRSTYNRLRQDFELPCVSTLTNNLTSKVKTR